MGICYSSPREQMHPGREISFKEHVNSAQSREPQLCPPRPTGCGPRPRAPRLPSGPSPHQPLVRHLSFWHPVFL